MEDKIIVELEFKNTGKDALDEAQKGLTDINKNQKATINYYEAILDRIFEYSEEVKKKALEEAKLTERQITANNRKLQSFKNLLKEYGGAFGSAIAKVIDGYKNLNNALSKTINKFLDVRVEIGKNTGIFLSAREAFGTLTLAMTKNFPRAVKAIQLGTRLVRIALISTGIGAIVAVLGVLIAAFIGMGKTAGDSTKGLSRLESVTIAIKSVFEALSITFKNTLQELKNFVNGGQNLFTTLKNIIGLGSGVAETVGKIADANRQIAVLNKEATKLEKGLATSIAENTDALNKYNETASDSNKTTGERIAAIKAASDIEAKIEGDKLKLLQTRIKAAELETSKYMEETDNRKEAEDVLQQLKNEYALEDASIEARKRKDKAGINGLIKEEGERIKALKKEYEGLRKEIQEIIDAQAEQGLTAEQQINADAERQKKAILNLQKATQEAAKAAGIAFDITPFKTALENIDVETKKQLKALSLSNQETQIALNKVTQEGVIAGLTESYDAQYTLEEAQQLELIELQKQTAAKLLRIKQEQLELSGQLDSAEGQAELTVLKNQLAEIDRKRAGVTKGATERRYAEGLALISQEEQLATMQLELLEESGDKTLTLEQEIAKKRLEIQLMAAEQRLALVLANAGENSPEAKAAKMQVDILKKQIKGLADTDPIRGFVKELLQINDDELGKIEEQIGSIVNNISTVFAIANQQARQRNAELIQSLTDRIETTKQKIAEEEEMQRNGYANNLALYKGQLEALEKEREIAAKKALEREKRQAQAQLAIESAIQVANYITTVTELLKKETGKFGLVGLVTAIAGIALVAGIIARAKATAQQFNEPPKFREGGYVSGASHAFGGKKIEVEGGEFVINRSATAKNLDLLEAINAGKFQGLELQKLLSGRYNINPLLNKMNEDRQVIVELQNAINYERMEQMFSSAHDRSMQKVINYLEAWPKKMLDSEGNEMIYWREGMKQRKQVIKKQAQ